MDAGLAAVVGAMAGASGAVLAAALAYRGALATAREQASATRDQWRRTHRRDTYITMLSTVRDHLQLVDSWYQTVHRRPDKPGDPVPHNMIMEWRLAEQEHGGGPLARATIAVQLEGPADLYETARALQARTRAYGRACLRHLAGEGSLDDVMIALDAYQTTLDELAEAARNRLDDTQ